MKKKIAAIALIVILLSLLTSGTLAYFTAEVTTNNVITTGNVKIKLLEYADDLGNPFPQEGLFNKLPGDTVTKIVKVENVGSGSAWVRIKAQSGAENYLGEAIIPPVADDGREIFTFVPGDAWQEKGGFYYYKKALAPGEVTEPFIKAVTLNPYMGNNYQSAKLSLSVTAYAVQSANNGNNWEEALGWPD